MLVDLDATDPEILKQRSRYYRSLEAAGAVFAVVYVDRGMGERYVIPCLEEWDSDHSEQPSMTVEGHSMRFLRKGNSLQAVMRCRDGKRSIDGWLTDSAATIQLFQPSSDDPCVWFAKCDRFDEADEILDSMADRCVPDIGDLVIRA